MNRFKNIKQLPSGDISVEVPTKDGWKERIYCEHYFKKHHLEEYKQLKNG